MPLAFAAGLDPVEVAHMDPADRPTVATMTVMAGLRGHTVPAALTTRLQEP